MNRVSGDRQTSTVVQDVSAGQMALAHIADRLLEEGDSLVTGLLELTHDRTADLHEDAASRSLLDVTVTENVMAGLHCLREGIDVSRFDAPTSALLHARVLARRDVSLSSLISAYRLGHQYVLDAAFTHLDELPVEHRVAALVLQVRRCGEFIDRMCEQVGRAYESERERWLASQSVVRHRWVKDLLDGEFVDRVAAEKALAYPLDAGHLAFTLWPADDMGASELISAVEEFRAHVASVLHARASLVVPTDEREARLWLALPATPGKALEALGPPPRVRLHIAIGRPGLDLIGFRTTARQSAQIRDILLTRLGERPIGAGRPGEPQWVRHEDVGPVALMLGSIDAVREFTVAALGDLARPSERNAMLRETLRTFLTHHRSHAATAKAMSLHRNSVHYRVQQATALLPGGARSLHEDLDVRTALQAAHWLGASVLASGPSGSG